MTPPARPDGPSGIPGFRVDIVRSAGNDASPVKSIDDGIPVNGNGVQQPPRHCSGENLGLAGECGFVADDTANLWDQRLCQPMTTRQGISATDDLAQ